MTAARRVLAGSLLIAAFVLMTQDAALAASYGNHVLNAAQQRIIKQQEERRRKLADEFRQSGPKVNFAYASWADGGSRRQSNYTISLLTCSNTYIRAGYTTSYRRA